MQRAGILCDAGQPGVGGPPLLHACAALHFSCGATLLAADMGASGGMLSPRLALAGLKAPARCPALVLPATPPDTTAALLPHVPQRNVGNLATHKDMNIMACIEYAVQGEQLIGWLSCALYRGRSLHMQCSMHPVCGAG